MKRMKVVLAAVLVSMLVILAGCQSIGGMDISKNLDGLFFIRNNNME